MRQPWWLLDHAWNRYSQTGEDGVVAKALSLLPERDRWCVEVGAWDGVHLSNTRRLIEEEQYRAVLIECDPGRHLDLRRNCAAHRGVSALKAQVGLGDADGLDRLLEATPIPAAFDFLSIDIDGNDYHVWKACVTHRPKLVCVEFNPTIPSEVSFVQPADARVSQGSSLAALDALGREKGYRLICVLPFNALLVDERYFEVFEIVDNSVATLRRDVSRVTWCFFGFDGSLHFSGNRRLPWHEVPLREADHQVLPSVLRKNPDRYARWQWLLLSLLRMWRRRSP